MIPVVAMELGQEENQVDSVMNVKSLQGWKLNSEKNQMPENSIFLE